MMWAGESRDVELRRDVKLKYEVALQEKELLPCEPLLLVVTLTNQGKRPLEILRRIWDDTNPTLFVASEKGPFRRVPQTCVAHHWSLGYWRDLLPGEYEAREGMLDYEWEQPDGPPVPYKISHEALRVLLERGIPTELVAKLKPLLGQRFSGYDELGQKLEQVLSPQELRDDKDSMIYGRIPPGAPILEQPGVYRLKATLTLSVGKRDNRVELRSPLVSVAVAEPRGEDRDALRLFRDALVRAEGLGAVAEGTAHPTAVDALERLIAEFPNSRYAIYARWALGRREWDRLRSWRSRPEDRRADAYARLLELLNPLADSVDSTYLTRDACYLVCTALHRQNRPLEQLLKYVRLVAAGPVDVPYVLEAKDQLRRLAEEKRKKEEYRRLQSLVKTGKASLEEELLYKLQSKNYWESKAPEALRRQVKTDEDVRTALLAIFSNETKDAHARGRALIALVQGGHDTEWALATCIKIIETREVDLLHAAFHSVSLIGDRRAAPAIRGLLEYALDRQLDVGGNRSPLALVGALEALTRLEGKGVAPLLERFKRAKWFADKEEAERLLMQVTSKR